MQTPPNDNLIQLTAEGLLCQKGNFYIDPWKPVETAVITHAHSDHARWGHQRYLCSKPCVPLLRKRLGDSIEIEALEYGETRRLSNATISLHPAGHILGSAQVRVEADGDVWVASGDYKRDPDPTCHPFELVPCDTFITEATFALPVYRWPSIQETVEQVHQWWQENKAQHRASVLFCYSLGKAQRVLAELMRHTEQTVLLHGAVVPLTEIYRDHGIDMINTEPALVRKRKTDFAGELIIAPPGANGTPWMKRFGKCSTGFCSGWMQIRGNRRRRGHDRGFILSDHVDWQSLIQTIRQTGAKRVLATHGQSDTLVRFLEKEGIEAAPLQTTFGQEDDEPLEKETTA